MITNKKMRSVIDTLRGAARDKLADVVHSRGWSEAQIKACQHTDPVAIEEEMQHILFMCDEMDKFLTEGRRDKLQRWLGWTQKTLQIHRVMSLSSMKKLNMPDKPSPKNVKPLDMHIGLIVVEGNYLISCMGSTVFKDESLLVSELRERAKESLEQGILGALHKLADEE